MADITKCEGKNCPLKDMCYRYTAKEGIWQSYFTEIPGEWKEDKFSCDMFWGEASQGLYNKLKDILK